MISARSASSDGLLLEMLHAGISEEDIVKIVVDLIIAAGDTVSNHY